MPSLSILRRIALQQGRRLKPLPKSIPEIEEEAEKLAAQRRIYHYPHVGSYDSSASHYHAKKHAVLQNGEFLFWRGKTDWDGWSQCRVCNQVIFPSYNETKDEAARREMHLKGENCRAILTVLQREFSHSAFCVLCGKGTTRSRWGFKLCSAKCDGRWMYGYFSDWREDVRGRLMELTRK